MHIPAWPQEAGRESELLQEVLRSPQWGGFHSFVKQFEREFACYQHSTHGISAANGTLTLELALTALDIGPGDEVIVPAISFISTATAVSRVGATPVFVDVEQWSFNIDLNAAAEAISPRTKALIAVHFGAALCDISALQRLCAKNHLLLLEDAAHAHGSEWEAQRAGSFGTCGSFSFQNGKVLTAGEGGCLVTSNDELAERMESIANQGRLKGRSFFEHHLLGSNFRLTAWQAAILIAQMERLDTQIAHRTRQAERLKRSAALDNQIVWQELPKSMTRSSQYLLLGRLRGGREKRDLLCSVLGEAGIPNTPFYPHTLPQNPLYAAGHNCRQLPCPNAEACVDDAFWLPHRVLLADDAAIDQIASTMHSALQTGRNLPLTYR